MATDPGRDLPIRTRPEPGPGAGARATATGASLAGLAARIDALGETTATFRTVVGERLVDLANELARATDAAGREANDARRANAATLQGIEAALRETEAGVARLDDLATAIASHLDGLTDELAATLEAVVRSSIEAAFDDVAARLGSEPGTRAAAPALPPAPTPAPAPAPAPATPTPAPAPAPPAALPSPAAQAATVAPVDLGPVLDAIDALDAGLAEVAARLPSHDTDPAVLAQVATRVDELVDLVGDVAAGQQAPTAERAVTERLDELADLLADLVERVGPPDAGAAEGHQAAAEPAQPDEGDANPSSADVVAAVTAVDGRLAAIEEAVTSLAAAPRDDAPRNATPDPEVVATLTRIDAATAATAGALERSVPGAEVVAAIRSLEEVLGRLAAAQADDLERVLEAVESPDDDLTLQAVEALARIEERLDRQGTAVPATSAGAADDDRIDALVREVTALRRRLAVRARPFSDDDVAALADAVAARLSPPARRPAAPSADATGQRRRRPTS